MRVRGGNDSLLLFVPQIPKHFHCGWTMAGVMIIGVCKDLEVSGHELPEYFDPINHGCRDRGRCQTSASAKRASSQLLLRISTANLCSFSSFFRNGTSLARKSSRDLNADLSKLAN